MQKSWQPRVGWPLSHLRRFAVHGDVPSVGPAPPNLLADDDAAVRPDWYVRFRNLTVGAHRDDSIGNDALIGNTGGGEPRPERRPHLVLGFRERFPDRWRRSHTWRCVGIAWGRLGLDGRRDGSPPEWSAWPRRIASERRRG